jgi:hypothetical protein
MSTINEGEEGGVGLGWDEMRWKGAGSFVSSFFLYFSLSLVAGKGRPFL